MSEGNKNMRIPFRKYAVGALILAVLFLFVKKDNVISWIGAELTLARQEKQIEFYRQDNLRLEQRIKTLTSDRDSLERYARETFLFAQPGDDVYVVEE